MIIKKEKWFPFLGERPFAVLCPFHQEYTPSCMIMPKKGTFHCLGCGKEGYIDTDDSLFTEEAHEQD